MCEKFLCYFIDKVASVRQNASVDLSEFVPADPFYSAVFGEFKPISLSLLSQVVHHMKPTNCSLDIVPAWMLKEVFSTLGLSFTHVFKFLSQFWLIPGCI